MSVLNKYPQRTQIEIRKARQENRKAKRDKAKQEKQREAPTANTKKLARQCHLCHQLMPLDYPRMVQHIYNCAVDAVCIE
jgi:hypothetical protein